MAGRKIWSITWLQITIKTATTENLCLLKHLHIFTYILMHMHMHMHTNIRKYIQSRPVICGRFMYWNHFICSRYLLAFILRSCRLWGTRTIPAVSAVWCAPRLWTGCPSPWTNTATSTASQTTTSEAYDAFKCSTGNSACLRYIWNTASHKMGRLIGVHLSVPSLNCPVKQQHREYDV